MIPRPHQQQPKNSVSSVNSFQLCTDMLRRMRVAYLQRLRDRDHLHTHPRCFLFQDHSPYGLDNGIK